jgi:hypothetical protein
MKFSITPVLGSVCIAAMVIGQTEPPEPPSLPTGYFSTDTNGVVTLTAPVKPVELEWQLTFEWFADTEFTNGVKYPITVQVPFVHDKGFVKINARQVEVK